MKAENDPVYKVAYDDGKRNTQLNSKWYNTNLTQAKPGDWHFVVTKERRRPAKSRDASAMTAN